MAEYPVLDGTGATIIAAPGGEQFRDILQGVGDQAAALAKLGIVPASPTAAGLVELATTAEVLAGVDAARAATPAGIAALAAASIKIGTFTRDLTAAGGAQAITGVGFQPRAVILLASKTDGAGFSAVGIDDGTLHYGWAHLNGFGSYAQTFRSIFVGADVSNYQSGIVSAMGADGFTVTWDTKTGAPTGTGAIFYLALR